MSHTFRQKTYPRSDLPRLRDIVQTQLNVEMAVTEEMMECWSFLFLLFILGRHRITLVPEREGEVTTEGGLNVVAHRERITECAKYIHDHNIHVSLFIDPNEDQIRASVMDGVDMIEINTAAYAEENKMLSHESKPVRFYRKNSDWKSRRDMDSHITILDLLVRTVPEIIEYNIGHHLLPAIFVGLPKAIQDIKAIISQ